MWYIQSPSPIQTSCLNKASRFSLSNIWNGSHLNLQTTKEPIRDDSQKTRPVQHRWIRSSLTSLLGPEKRSVEAPRSMKASWTESWGTQNKKKIPNLKRDLKLSSKSLVKFRNSRKIEIRFVKLRNSEHLNIQRLQLILQIVEIEKSNGCHPFNRQESNKAWEMSRVDKGKQWD